MIKQKALNSVTLARALKLFQSINCASTRQFTLLLILSCLTQFQPALAEGTSAANSKISGDLPQLQGRLLKDGVVRLSIQTPEGTHPFKLKKIDDAHFAKDDAESLEGSSFFQGENIRPLSKSDSSRRIAADIIGNVLRVNFFGRRTARPYIFEVNLNSLKGKKFSAEGRLSHVPSTFNMGCAYAVPGLAKAASGDEILKIEQNAISRDLSLAIDTDYSFYKGYASSKISKRRNANKVKNQIRAVLNRVESIYTLQLGLFINLKSISVDLGNGRPYKSTTSERLLTQFRNYSVSHKQLGNADVYHLFTGKYLEGSVVGLAYVGSTCRADFGNYSYGLSARTNEAVQALVTAHEIAHNLGASHKEGPSSLMSPKLDSQKTQFLPESISEIFGFITQYGACLAAHI